MKVVITMKYEQVQPEITATDIENILNWINDNILSKLPENSSVTYQLILES